MKKTILLYKAIKLKDELENSKTEDYAKLKELYKQRDRKGKLTPTATEEIETVEKLRSEKSTLTIQLHVLITEQNLKIGKGEKLPNAHYIKFRSEKAGYKRFLEDIKFDPTVIKEVTSEISDLDNKLSKFNLSHKVKVEISQELLGVITTNLDDLED